MSLGTQSLRASVDQDHRRVQSPMLTFSLSTKKLVFSSLWIRVMIPHLPVIVPLVCLDLQPQAIYESNMGSLQIAF